MLIREPGGCFDGRVINDHLTWIVDESIRRTIVIKRVEDPAVDGVVLLGGYVVRRIHKRVLRCPQLASMKG